MSPTLNRRRIRREAAGATCCAVLLAACGSSIAPGGPSTYAQGLRYATCMRSHGVSSYPDPAAGGSAGGTAVPIDERSPAFRGALKACAPLHPGARMPAAVNAAQRAGMIAFARCLRGHGVPDYPDPRFGPGGHGIEEPVLGAQADSPAFRHAVSTCRHVGSALPGF